MLRSYEGKDIVSHSGGAAGYRSNFVRIPNEDICIILLNNTENANVELISKNLINILINKPYKIPFEVKINKEELAKCIGTYQVTAPPMVMYITVDDGRLAAQVSGQQKTILLAESDNHFFSEEADGFIEFEKGNTGKTDKIILNQGCQEFTGNRIYPSWGLLGSATLIGWDGPDIKFTEDTLKKGLWILNNIKLNTGEIKFRFNNDWNINYGDNGNDKMLDLYGENIKITEAGIYDIVLDLTDETKPRYSIFKNQ
jgi:Domain of unknown function (DUF3471)